MKKIFKLSLMAKVILVMTLAATIPVLVDIGYAVYKNEKVVANNLYFMTNANRARTQNTFSSTVEGLKTFHNNPSLRGILRAINGNGTDPVDGSTLEQWINRFNTSAGGFLANHEEFLQFDLVGSDGKVLAHIERSGNNVKRASFAELSENKIANKNHPDAYISSNKESGKLKTVFIPQHNWKGQPALQFSIPVKDPSLAQKSQSAHLVLTVSSEALSKKLQNIDTHKEGLELIVDSRQKVLFSQNKGSTGKWYADKNLTLPTEVRDQIQTNSGGQVSANGKTYMVSNSIYPAPFDKGYHWHYIYALDTSSLISEAFSESSALIGSLLTVLSCVVLVGLFFARSIVKPLRNIADRVGNEAHQVANTTSMLSSSSQVLSEGAVSQTEAMQQIASSIEETASMTRQNQETTNDTKSISISTRAAAEEGSKEMEEMVSAMYQISESSSDIANITKTIEEIAFQTNILALNAAVEAARAGESGQGFGVVAEEVRNLAQRSAQAASETSRKIEVSIQNAKNGETISKKVSERLKEILSRVQEMDTLIAQIAEASNEQVQGIGQINNSVTRIDGITQNNTSSIHEASQSINTLNEQADHLRGITAELLALVEGEKPDAEKNKKEIPMTAAKVTPKVPEESEPEFENFEAIPMEEDFEVKEKKIKKSKFDSHASHFDSIPMEPTVTPEVNTESLDEVIEDKKSKASPKEDHPIPFN